MGRKNAILPFKAIDAGDMSADITSEVTDMMFQDNALYQVSWSGTTPVGELFVEVTNDDYLLNPSTAVWSRLDFGSSITVSGNTGNHIININQYPGRYMRLFYDADATPGTGTLNAVLTSKQLGG